MSKGRDSLTKAKYECNLFSSFIKKHTKHNTQYTAEAGKAATRCCSFSLSKYSIVYTLLINHTSAQGKKIHARLFMSFISFLVHILGYKSIMKLINSKC